MAEDTKPVNEDKWCFAWFAAKAPTTGTERAALVTGSKWQGYESHDFDFISRRH